MEFIFKNYRSYRSITRPLSLDQRRVLWAGMSSSQQAHIERDFEAGNWDHVIIKDEIDFRLKQLKERYGEDLVSIRVRIILEGNKFRVSRKFWLESFKTFKIFPRKFRRELFSGIHAASDKSNPAIMILSRNKNDSIFFKNTEPSSISDAEFFELKTFLSSEKIFFCDFLLFLGLTKSEILNFGGFEM